MTLPRAHSATTLRAMSVASEPGIATFRTLSVASEPGTATLVSPNQLSAGTATLVSSNQLSAGTATLVSPNQLSAGTATLRTVGVAPAHFSSVQYVNDAVDGTALQGNLRYLVPVQRASDSYVMVNQTPQMLTSQMLTPQMLTPVYLQNVQRVSTSSLEETDSFQHLTINGQASSAVQSPSPSPIKTPEPLEVFESSSVQNVSIDVKNHVASEVKTDFKFEPEEKLDTRFFGELLAEVYRKNNDIHTCISEHVTKIHGRKYLLDLDHKEKADIEHLIPKGVSELTKQQIRYLLQTRITADKTMRLLLSTFSSLREELVHLQDDLRRLESEKEQLNKDLSFKADQTQQYERLVESVRENNRQLQMSLKESTSSQRNLETQLMNNRGADSSKDFRIKDLEGSKRLLEQENELLRKKLEGQCSSATLQSKTQELSRHYEQMLKELREEKEKELLSMRSQLVKIQTEYTTEQSADKTLQLKISELLTKLEQRESTIRRLEEEIRRLQQDKKNSSESVTQTVITKKYQNQYPILGLLSDDYQYTSSPIKESKTIVIKRTGEMTKKEFCT
ncbi:protein POF1B [Neoarius graeffei]|uniref:protein POF1B n=1 Tax=Neoarius graeffei TaxID=443677 RepID=UPI00298C53FE|nr:protein POF1B [Neoarius graeffei]